MRGLQLLAVTAGLASVEGLNLAKRTDGGAPRVVGYDIERRQVNNPVARDRSRRRATNTIQESLTNEETLYFANASLGTPAQTLQLHIDTGSSDLWVNVPNSAFCKSRGSPCAQAGTYNANSSSTYKYINGDFNITYEDGSGSAGDYASDTFSIGGATITNQEFGIGYESSSEEGILGVGYATNEAILENQGASTYSNVPQKMVQQGLINTNAYSLWLNDLDASTGSILFGGVDTDKYTGTLETLPVIQEYGGYSEFVIALTGVGLNGKSGSVASNVNSPALLDSGSSLMYLPNAIAQDLYTALGAKYDSQEGAALIDCAMAYNDTTIDFTFSSPTISVSLSELVIVAGTSNRGGEVCILGIAPAEGTTPVLGDTFIRSAYIVYDLENNEISLAQTKFNVTSSNVLEITNSTSSGGGGVPSASVVQNAVTSVAVASGGAINGGLSGFGGTITSSAGAAHVTPAPVLRRDLASFGAAVAAAGMGVVLAL